MLKNKAVYLLIIVLAVSINSLVCCSPSFCSNNSGCQSKDPCCECCCLKSAGNITAIVSPNPGQTDPVFTAEPTNTPVISAVKVTIRQDREVCFKDPRLMSKLNECKFTRQFVSRKDFV